MIEPLLVPMRVDALVVAPDDAVLALEGEDAFGPSVVLPPGVHLRWSPPPGLVVTRLKRAPEGWIAETPTPPDRWLVVRYGAPGEASGGRRPRVAWVLDGRTGRAARLGAALQLVAPLPTRAGPSVPGPRGVQGGLIWHDPLDGAIAGPLSYGVFGWYSAPDADDPLWRAGLDAEGHAWPGRRAAWIQRAGWQSVREPGADDHMDERAPDHLILHGAVVDVAWGGGGGRMAGLLGPRAPRVGLYPSAARALGELGPAAAPDARSSRALEALALSPWPARSVAIEDLAQEAHAEGFELLEQPDGPPAWRAAAPVLAIGGGGRLLRRAPDGPLRCRAGLPAVVTALAIDDPSPEPGLPVAARQIVAPLPWAGATRDARHRRLVRALSLLADEVALFAPSSAGLMAAAWSRGHEAALTLVGRFEAATSLCLATAHPGAGALADVLFRGTGLLPSPVAVNPWSQPWCPQVAEAEIEVHGRLDGAPDSAALWRLDEAELDPRTPGGAMAILPVPHVTVQTRVHLDAAALGRAAASARPRRGYDARGVLGEPPGQAGATAADADALAQLDLLFGPIAGLRDAARVALGTDLPQGALRITRLRLVDGFGTWATLIGEPDGGRMWTQASVAAPMDDDEALGRAQPPGSYHALLRPRLGVAARLRLELGPPAARLQVVGEAVRLMGPEGATLPPVARALRAWLDAPAESGALGREASLARAARLRRLAGLPSEAPALALVPARLWLDPIEGPLWVRDLRARLGDLGSREDGLLGWLLDGDPAPRLLHDALLDPQVWAELGWREAPSPDLRPGEDLPLDAPISLTLLMDPARAVSVRTGVLPRLMARLPSGT